VFLLVFIFDPFCFRVLVGRGFGQSAAEERTVHGQVDSPRPPRGQSVFPGVATGGSVAFSGQFAAQAGECAVRVRTVRRTWPDSALANIHGRRRFPQRWSGEEGGGMKMQRPPVRAVQLHLRLRPRLCLPTRRRWQTQPLPTEVELVHVLDPEPRPCARRGRTPAG
jgi:hypothetical protein